MSRKTTHKSGNEKFDISLYVIGIFFYHGVAHSVNLYNNTHIIIAPFSEMPGGTCKSNRLVIRLGAGAWCLVALVLGLAYNSTLITYVISPNNPPLVNSIKDVARNPKIRVLVEKGWGVDIFLSVYINVVNKI